MRNLALTPLDKSVLLYLDRKGIEWLKLNHKKVYQKYILREKYMDRKEMIVEFWMKMWESKTMPPEFKDYEEFRKLREYWLEREQLDFDEAVSLYNLKGRNYENNVQDLSGQDTPQAN